MHKWQIIEISSLTTAYCCSTYVIFVLCIQIDILYIYFLPPCSVLVLRRKWAIQVLEQQIFYWTSMQTFYVTSTPRLTLLLISAVAENWCQINYWCVYTGLGVHWCVYAGAGVHWCVYTGAGVHWCVFTGAGVQWCVYTGVGVHWCVYQQPNEYFTRE